MKCSNCGHENKDKAKFCTKCGEVLSQSTTEKASSDSSNSKYVIVTLIAVIIVLAVVIGYFAFNSHSGVDDSASQSSADSNNLKSDDDSDSAKTKTTSESKSKKWVSIGSYSGSGSGSKTIKVPKGKIKVELSAYPILNYATNHLYVSGTNGESGGVDWGSSSAVETRSDSFECNLNSEEEFTIDYYETVNWNVEFYRYQ